MNSITNISPAQLRKAANIQEKIQALQRELGQLLGGPAETPEAKTPKKRRRMSAAGKANIRAGVKARWAKYNAAKGKPLKQAKRKFTAAGRAAIAAAARARWAKARAAGKSRL